MSFRNWIAKKISSYDFPSEEKDRLTKYPPWYSRSASFKDWDSEKAIKEGLKESVWVYACVNKIAEAVSSVPWYVEERVGDNEWERVVDHPVEQLLRNPNPNPIISGTSLFKLEVNHRQLGGNAIWHKNLQGGTPIELWPIKPHNIEPRISDDGIIQKYVYTSDNATESVDVPVEEIIHFQFVNPNNFHWGMSPLQAAAKVVDTDTETVKYNKKMLENSAISSGVFTYNDNLEREQWEEARERVAEHMQEPGLPWVMGNDANWEQMSFSAEDLQILEQHKFSMYEIHTAFDVDPLITGAPDTGGRQNKKEAKREFWQDNIIPYLESLKEGIENNLLSHWDDSYLEGEVGHELRMKYDVSDVSSLREDFSKKIENAKTLWDMGFTLNQINQRLNLGFDEIENGDANRFELEGSGENPMAKMIQEIQDDDE